MTKFSKVERRAFSRINEATLLLTFPITIVFCMVFMHSQFSGFIPETVALFAITIISFMIANRPSIYETHADSFRVLHEETFAILINMMIAIVFSATVLTLADLHNPNKNSIDLVVWIVLVSVTVIVVILAGTDGLFEKMKRGRKHLYSGFTFLLTIPSIAYLVLVGMCTHFGTQFIWLPVVALSVILGVCYFGKKSYSSYHSEFYGMKKMGNVTLLPIAIGLISTVYQFWFTQLFGISLYEIIAGIVAIGLLILISRIISNKFNLRFWPTLTRISSIVGFSACLYFFWNYEILPEFLFWQLSLVAISVIGIITYSFFEAKKIKERKLEAEQEKIKVIELEKYRQVQKQREDNMSMKVTLTIKAINEESEVLWNEILFVVRYYNQDINRFPKILQKISEAPLEQVISISQIKQQIVWSGDFQIALHVIEKLATKSYKDDELQLLIKQVSDFIKLVEQYKDFNGYTEVIHEIKSRCSTIFNLLPKE